MKIKSCLKQVRDRLFLNATKNAVREVVRDEVDRLVAHIEEYKAIHTTKGGGILQPYTLQQWRRKSETITSSSTVGITEYCTTKIWRNQYICGRL